MGERWDWMGCMRGERDQGTGDGERDSGLGLEGSGQ